MSITISYLPITCPIIYPRNVYYIYYIHTIHTILQNYIQLKIGTKYITTYRKFPISIFVHRFKNKLVSTISHRYLGSPYTFKSLIRSPNLVNINQVIDCKQTNPPLTYKSNIGIRMYTCIPTQTFLYIKSRSKSTSFRMV